VNAVARQDPSPADRDSTARAAVEAAVGVARHHGLRVDDPVVLHDLFSVRVHLRPAPVVARIPTWITQLRPGTDWLTREVDVGRHLSRLGLPIVAPSVELPPGPHHAGPFAVTYWTFAARDPERTVSAETCAAMLPELHAGLASYPGELPDLLASTVDLPRWLATLDPEAARLGPHDVEVLHATARRVHQDLAGAAETVLHGDAHPGNILATVDGPCWIDFEEVCRGPREWDLATIGDPAVADSDQHADPVRLAGCTRLRGLQVALCMAHLHAPFADLPMWVAGLRGAVDALHAAITDPSPPDARP
jgi:aminoglycoside phosphotransferase (APT) family kinase protein